MRIKYLARQQGPAVAAGTEPPRRRTLGEATQDFLAWSGIMKKISDEEYLRRLKTQRAELLNRIAELEEAQSGRSSEDCEGTQDGPRS
jgi:hypothetical protein